MFFVILLIVLALFFVVAVIYLSSSKKILLNAFKKGNVLVFGAKGKGKDLLFQWVINKKKEPYLSNINYGHEDLYNHIDIKKDLDINITYDDLINGDFECVEKNELLEGKDIYISDGGVVFPSQYDTRLHKDYKSLPLIYATQRHLFNSNFNVNTQALSRIWKALREQADSYIKCRRTIKLPFVLLVQFTYFEKYKTAEADIFPLKKPIIENKEHKTMREQFYATHGDIRNGIIVLSKKNIHYDTRAFHEIIFGTKFGAE